MIKQFIKDKLGINLDARFSNPQYWFMLAMAIVVPIVSYLGLNPEDITSWKILIDMLGEAIMNPYLLTLVIVNIYNATIDGTTKGFKDSPMVLNGENSNELLEELKELNDFLERAEEELKLLNQDKDDLEG